MSFELINAHCNEPPPPLKDFLASYPPQLQAIVDRALAKDRNERYASAEEFALELGQLQSQLKQEMIHRYLQEATQLIDRARVVFVETPSSVVP